MSDEIVLVVDDEEPMRRSVSMALTANGFECVTAASVREARLELSRRHFDLVVCDLRMPGESGLDLVKDIEAGTREIPVLMMTVVDNPAVAHEAAIHGTNGYLVKPFSVNELRINVDQALEEGRRRAARASFEDAQEVRIQEVRSAMEELEAVARTTDEQAAELMYPLSEAVGRRDLETGAHIRRIGESSALLAAASGMTADEVEAIRLTAPMHDVGKVAIPDSVLLKPGRLSEEERSLMERHAEIGHDILSGSSSPLLDLAAQIALSHHEKFDGSGYPRGLKGEEIPLEGRIVAVADVFDAITSDRPYREPLSLDEAFRVMVEGRGTHFDPRLLDLFLDRIGEVRDLAARYSDIEPGAAETGQSAQTPSNGFQPDESTRRKRQAAAIAYFEAMNSGDGAAAERVALESLREGMTVETLYSEVLTPAMRQIGELWQGGAITVADEHIATAITSRVMASVFASTESRHSPRSSHVFMAALEGQQHSLGLRMAGDVLALAGFQVSYLGGDVPRGALMATAEARDADLLCLSWTLQDTIGVDAVLDDIHRALPGKPVMLGGRGVPAEVTYRGPFEVCDDLDLVVSSAENLLA